MIAAPNCGERAKPAIASARALTIFWMRKPSILAPGARCAQVPTYRPVRGRPGHLFCSLSRLARELGYLGRILNQDSATFGRVQRGLHASVKPNITVGRYQESRIRHFHATLDAYLDTKS